MILKKLLPVFGLFFPISVISQLLVLRILAASFTGLLTGL